MPPVNNIVEWSELGTEYRLYVKHYQDENDKTSINIIFEDATRDKVTEINVPSKKVKELLTAINGSLITRKYEINV